MKTILYALCGLLAGTVAYAAEADFRLESGKMIKMVELRDGSLLLSTSCVKNSQPQDCKAWKEAKVSSARGVHPEGGVEPGAMVCSKSGGVVHIAQELKSARNNEESLCVFSDGSAISCGSLYAIALKNR